MTCENKNEEEKRKNNAVIYELWKNDTIYSKRDLYIIINNIIDQYCNAPQVIINKSDLVDATQWYGSDEWIFDLPM